MDVPAPPPRLVVRVPDTVVPPVPRVAPFVVFRVPQPADAAVGHVLRRHPVTLVLDLCSWAVGARVGEGWCRPVVVSRTRRSGRGVEGGLEGFSPGRGEGCRGRCRGLQSGKGRRGWSRGLQPGTVGRRDRPGE